MISQTPMTDVQPLDSGVVMSHLSLPASCVPRGVVKCNLDSTETTEGLADPAQ